MAALKVTESARARILKAGGEIITLDQLAVRAPRGENTLLVQVRLDLFHYFYGVIYLIEPSYIFLADVIFVMC